MGVRVDSFGSLSVDTAVLRLSHILTSCHPLRDSWALNNLDCDGHHDIMMYWLALELRRIPYTMCLE